MQSNLNSRGIHEGYKMVAIAMADQDREKVPDRTTGVRRGSYRYVRVADLGHVSLRDASAKLRPLEKMWKEGFPQYRRLKLIEPTIQALKIVLVLRCLSVIAQRIYPLCEVQVIGADGTRIPDRTEVLGRIEA